MSKQLFISETWQKDGEDIVLEGTLLDGDEVRGYLAKRNELKRNGYILTSSEEN